MQEWWTVGRDCRSPLNARCTLLTSVSILICDFARLERTAAEIIDPNVRKVGFACAQTRGPSPTPIFTPITDHHHLLSTPITPTTNHQLPTTNQPTSQPIPGAGSCARRNNLETCHCASLTEHLTTAPPPSFAGHLQFQPRECCDQHLAILFPQLCHIGRHVLDHFYQHQLGGAGLCRYIFEHSCDGRATSDNSSWGKSCLHTDPVSPGYVSPIPLCSLTHETECAHESPVETNTGRASCPVHHAAAGRSPALTLTRKRAMPQLKPFTSHT